MSDVVLIRPQPSNIANNVYVNLQIKGSDNSNPTLPHNMMSFSESYSNLLLGNMEEYYITVVTISIPTHSVPLIDMYGNIQTGSTQGNPDLTDWYLCYTCNGHNYGGYVEYSPLNNLSKPLAPSNNPPTYEATSSPYYYVSNYNNIVTMINTRLKQSYNLMFAAEPSLGLAGLTVNDQPYITFDDETNKFTLVYNKLLIGLVDLYMNDRLNIKLPGFYTYFAGVSTGRDYKIIFEVLPNNSLSATLNVNSQQYAGSPSAFQTINQLVITSSSIRGRGEFVTTNQSSQLPFPSILFSLNPLLETPKDQKSTLIYTASGSYRLVDITGSGDLRNLDLGVYYTDQNNNLLPIYLHKGSVATVKLLFVKKSLFNNQY